MGKIDLCMQFVDQGALQREFVQNLQYGRCFVPSTSKVEVEVLSECTLTLQHPSGDHFTVAAQVVLVTPAGLGLQLRLAAPAAACALERFSTGQQTPEATIDAATSPSNTTAPPELDAEVESELNEQMSASDVQGSGEPVAAETDPRPPSDLQSVTRIQELRSLTMAQQQKIARQGELSDRVQLERLYGKAVWDALLSNPRLSVPEVARIARKGTVPRPLLDQIIDNRAWINTAQVRRALLGNTRVGTDGAMKLLRATPRHELKLIQKGTSYSPFIRDQARKLFIQSNR